MSESPSFSQSQKNRGEIPDGILRSKNLVALGFSRREIQEMVGREELEHIGRGLYMKPGLTITESHYLAQLGARIPLGVICLSSALQFHQMTTVSPWKVHLMLPVGTATPKIEYPPTDIIFSSGKAYSEGIEEKMVEGVNIKVTSIAKTIVDCFKYRNKTGIDIALEALKEGIEERKTTREEIYYYTKICRMQNVMRPYLELLSL
jgi:predicted transcriptional regulator of viral defense system